MASQQRLTAVIEREGDGYVAWCSELDIASQGATIEDAKKNLVEALELFVKVADEGESKGRRRNGLYVTPLEVASR